MNIKDIVKATQRYNLHSHTQFCDGKAPIAEMAESACKSGLSHYGVTPHSPVPLPSPCNMAAEQTQKYFSEMEKQKEIFGGCMRLYTGMEIDYLSSEWGPHIDYFQKLHLEYSIGSVHFVPNQDGHPIDCDGRYPRFAQNLKDGFGGDIRYVTEKYFEQVLSMLERGGFDILGHPDKIASNASEAYPGIEDEGWYQALIEDVASHGASAGVIVEINTKAFADKKRFFPAVRWWEIFYRYGCEFVVNSDAHYPDKINAGREKALSHLIKLKEKKKNSGYDC